MKKIMIIGSGGAGKSTFARKLGRKLNIPVHHLDAHLWKPGWTMTTREEQQDIQQQLMAGEQWIIDGNYNGTLDIRLQQADTVIFMDINRRICLYQAMKRYFMYRNQSRPDMAADCDEKIDLKFLQWIWNYPRDKRPGVVKMLEEVRAEKQVVIISSPKEAERYLKH